MFEKYDRVMLLNDISCCKLHNNIKAGSVGSIRQIAGSKTLVRLNISPHGKYNAYVVNQFNMVKI